MSIDSTNSKDIEDFQSSFPLPKTVPLVINNLMFQLQGIPMYIPCWSGAPGIGKTTYAKMIAKKLNLDMLYFSMNKPYESLTGLPLTNATKFDEANRDKNYVYWSEPEIIHLANEKARKKDENGNYVNNGCLIFLDDAHIMTPDIQKCFFEFVLERKLGNYPLDKRCCILAAMNSSAFAGFDGFLSAIMNRLQIFKVFMPFDSWYENCGAQLNPLIAGFVRCFKDDLEEAENTDKTFATYRSWVQLSTNMAPIYEQYLKTRNELWLLDNVYMLACSLMGADKANDLKVNIGHQLRFDYEKMVNENAYYIDPNDITSQLCFGNILRYVKTQKDMDNLVNYICNLIKDEAKNQVGEYENAIINVMYEAVALSNMYRTKEGDKYCEEQLENIKYFQHKMFRNSNNRVHKIMKRLNRAPGMEYDDEDDEE